MASVLRLVVLSCTLWTFVSATCYWPTGNETYDRDLTEHRPCSNDTTSPLNTICCALNRDNPSGGDVLDGRTNDECLPNGVCRNRVLDHGTMQISYWRETCTSKDWKTGKCLDVCADNWTSGNGTTGAIMTPCDDTAGSLKWCCGVDKSCCNDPKQVKILAFEFGGAIPNTSKDQAAPTSSTTAGTTTTAGATTTTAAAATTTPTSGPENEEKSSGLSTGAKAGIGIGAALGAIALLAVGFFIARRTGNKRNTAAVAPVSPYVPEKQQHRHELEPTHRAELPYSPVSQTSPGKPPQHMAHHGGAYEMA